MDYEEKYKSALKWMQSLYGGLHGATKEEAEKYFSELKESEGERIRKKLISFVENWKNFRPNSPFDDYAVYTSDRDECDRILAWLEKQGEQKTDDKVEPKFKVGDWIILPLGIIAHIDSLNSTDYQVTTTDGKNCDFKISKQDNYHLWSMQDAKDGDVLYSIDSKQPFIYKGRPQFSQARGYCCINKFGEFAIWNTSKCVICTDKYIPATKKQYDTLMKAMIEAGYTFDFEKKEFGKIESKTLDAAKVIEWLECKAFQGWAEPIDIRPIIRKFKKDFGI